VQEGLVPVQNVCAAPLLLLVCALNKTTGAVVQVVDKETVEVVGKL
jgi:hypothetical protein